MLYLVFTVDGDWKEYFDVKLSPEKRQPDVKRMQDLIEREMEAAARCLEGRFVHFIHASPCAGNFFLKEPFVASWRLITQGGGDIGVHCHEDLPYSEYYFEDTPRMKKAISAQVTALRGLGLEPCAYRGGFLAFSHTLIPVLEENGLYFDFSCEPGRHLVHNGKVVSDWRGAPGSLYRMSYADHRKEGDSSVYEIPMGVSAGSYLYFEKSDLKTIEKAAIELKNRSAGKDIIVSVLTHTYEYRSGETVEDIVDKISILKKYGRFINIEELKEVVKHLPGEKTV
ncbi:MAG: hypothetical protein JW919_06115 [Candidatus Omnitrophica bacterium]|nr:hypothetical protein [Candidatus Omnitrophota bacterium]